MGNQAANRAGKDPFFFCCSVWWWLGCLLRGCKRNCGKDTVFWPRLYYTPAMTQWFTTLPSLGWRKERSLSWVYHSIVADDADIYCVILVVLRVTITRMLRPLCTREKICPFCRPTWCRAVSRKYRSFNHPSKNETKSGTIISGRLEIGSNLTGSANRKSKSKSLI